MSSKYSSGDTSDLKLWRPDRPHNALPRLPPDSEVESKAVLKQCVSAGAALAELSQAAHLIPDPAMLINTLPILEARASSQIENVVTTEDALFRYIDAEGPADAATKETLRYRHALLEGFGALTAVPLCTRTAEVVCSRIKGVEMEIRRVPGTALANSRTGDVIYTPPDGEAHLRDLLANWEEFLHEAHDIEPLVRMAVGHYQFEAIHPFTDGNGRTGRILNMLFLVEQGLLTLPVLYLSRYIIATRDDYYRLLNDVTRNAAWEPWLLYMLSGVEETARWTTAKIAAIRSLSVETRRFVRARLPKIYSHELLEILFQQPYSRIANLVDSKLVGRQAASRHLKALAAEGVLVEQAHGREKLFLNARLLSLLTQDDNSFDPLS